MGTSPSVEAIFKILSRSLALSLSAKRRRPTEKMKEEDRDRDQERIFHLKGPFLSPSVYSPYWAFIFIKDWSSNTKVVYYKECAQKVLTADTGGQMRSAAITSMIKSQKDTITNSQVRERVQWGSPLQTHWMSPIIYIDVNVASFSLNLTPHDSLVKLISQSQVLFY